MDYWILLVLAFLVADKSWHLTGLLATKLTSPERLQQLIRERQELHQQQQSLSAQDHYAKWTKNNRRLDVLDRDIARVRKNYLESVEATKARLAKLKLLVVTVPFTALKFYKGKLPVYALPKGMFPRFIEGTLEHGWLYMALAPLNMKQFSEGASVAVSLGIWLFALLRVLGAIEFVLETLREQNPQVATETAKVHARTAQAASAN
uniref:Golgi to ER traffic protein 1 n=2 Tax=Eremothecium gossypii (strain ATCC 10895 / CBS 109.51 / FGSC 9923 / NRRL Y-1056) TaxID=284811 RepID=GET1_EREGS|nr:RecName: Full=Golgi to ER traffic protein 1; AltName: Full=Guided entry of tail-anchored proteins 1 [Eremothecium gossypii ATCC 10895]